MERSLEFSQRADKSLFRLRGGTFQVLNSAKSRWRPVPSLRVRLQAVMDGRAKPPRISMTLGMKLVKLSEGSATMTMAVGRRFHNPMGTLHGGIMTDLADAAMGIATVSTLADDETFTTLELKMNFLRPVVEGVITGEGTVLHRGRKIVLSEAVVRDDEGRLVAKGTATQMIMEAQKGRRKK